MGPGDAVFREAETRSCCIQGLADEVVDTAQGQSPILAAGDVYWHLSDHLNTVRDVVQHDPAANSGAGETTVANHLTYSAFGELLNQTDPTPPTLSLQFTARYFDPATGLQWNLNRWYNPVDSATSFL